MSNLNYNVNSNEVGNNVALDMSQSSFYDSSSSHTASASFVNYDVEDSLDLTTKLLVKKIHQEHKLLDNVLLESFQNNPNYQDFEIGLELIKIHTGNCIHFISNISCNFLILV